MVMVIVVLMTVAMMMMLVAWYLHPIFAHPGEGSFEVGQSGRQ